ncbi:MAG: hypothetical protein K2L95_04265 [Alphaproteobacteria bacterium]|nr:hypothetical protein [Alphaproteobacteria bacterium]
MRIYITGGSGSGKTTLAKKMAKCCDIPYLDLDKVKWINDGGKRFLTSRIIDERKEIIANFIAQNQDWICDGVYYHDWIDAVLENVDIVIVLRTSRWRRHYRCIKRAFCEEALRTMSVRALWDLLCWDHKYDAEYWPMLKDKLDKFGIPYKIICADSIKESSKLIDFTEF